LANFNGKEHLRHRAVSLRQHGFLVGYSLAILTSLLTYFFGYSGMAAVEWNNGLFTVQCCITNIPVDVHK